MSNRPDTLTASTAYLRRRLLPYDPGADCAMAERTPSAAALTRRAVERIHDGEHAAARLILAEALHSDPLYEPAWLWFAHIAEDPGQRRFCLEQAAAANPDSRAKQGSAEAQACQRCRAAGGCRAGAAAAAAQRRRLRPGRAVAPTRAQNRKAIGLGLGALALVAAAALAFVVLTVERPEPLYVALRRQRRGRRARRAFGNEPQRSALFRAGQRRGRHQRARRRDT